MRIKRRNLLPQTALARKVKTVGIGIGDKNSSSTLWFRFYSLLDWSGEPLKGCKNNVQKKKDRVYKMTGIKKKKVETTLHSSLALVLQLLKIFVSHFEDLLRYYKIFSKIDLKFQ